MTIRVARPGLLTTIQDLGRVGFRRHGVAPGGAVDTLSLRVANILVGNAPGAAALEITLLGPTLLFDAPAVVAIAGGDLGPLVDGRPVAAWRPLAVPAGACLSFAGPRRGYRGYLACKGGFAVPAVLGGRATDLVAGIGGVAGRPLRAGDVLACDGPPGAMAAAAARLAASPARWAAATALRPAFTGTLRVLPGDEAGWFAPETIAAWHEGEYTVGAESDRMGCRLAGPRLELVAPRDMLSECVVAGTVQVPPSGQPIALLAGHATTGGYPRIAQVATVDLPELAQAPPGTRLRFLPIDSAESRRLLLERERALAILAQGIALAGRLP